MAKCSNKKNKNIKEPEFKPRFKINEYRDMADVNPYTPSQIREAYWIPADANGEGKTIAIIDAYGNKNLLSDLNEFSKKFNLPDANVEIKYPDGEPTVIDKGWAIETNLDVQWAHALAPLAKILVVISKDATVGGLFNAVNYAVAYGAKIISMSWGGNEFREQVSLDPIFNKKGIAFFAASGDSGTIVYPSSSPYVISVGGTSLSLDAGGKRTGDEIAWVGSGGGISEYEPKPSWQNISCSSLRIKNNRMTPDVAFFADSFPGLAVYVGTKVSNGSGWMGIGGTSAAAPCWAAITASLKTSNEEYVNFQEILYKLYCNNLNDKKDVFYDIKNGNNKNYYAGEGYDYVTGLGSPIVNNLLDLYSDEESNS